MREDEQEDEEEKHNDRAISENIENVKIFPCLLVIPKALDEEEFFHYLKETKERAKSQNAKKLFKDDLYDKY